MSRGRSKFEVFMDVLTIFYEYKSLKACVLIRKASLTNHYQREIIDKLIYLGVISVNNKNFLFLRDGLDEKLNDLIVSYKKSKELYVEVYKNG